MPDLEPEAQQQAQVTLQHIVDRLGREYQGADVQQVRELLPGEIAAAGLPEQPVKWVTDAGAEIVAGRRLIVDRSIRDEDDPRR